MPALGTINQPHGYFAVTLKSQIEILDDGQGPALQAARLLQLMGVTRNL